MKREPILIAFPAKIRECDTRRSRAATCAKIDKFVKLIIEIAYVLLLALYRDRELRFAEKKKSVLLLIILQF